MNSGAGDTTQLVPGFPIRTPWDHSSVDSSPRPIAASHVLHRLLVPRHPPFALDNLTKDQNTTHANNNSTTTQNPTPPKGPSNCRDQKMLSRPLSTSQQTTNHNPTRASHTQKPRQFDRKEVIGPEETPRCEIVPSDTQQGAHRPAQPHHQSVPRPQTGCTKTGRPLSDQTRQCLRHLSPYRHTRAVRVLDRFHGQVLLRKEVIQPHLPVRLPCYDFVPIASPTFDRSLPLRG